MTSLQNVTAVGLEGDDILLSLGPGPGGQPGDVMTVRFVAVNQIVVEDSDPFTREK